MALTPGQLLEKRFKVIADYPDASFLVGTVWYDSEAVHYVQMSDEGNCEKMPHLFKRLEWWEERKPEELPEYLVDKSVGKAVVKVFSWHGDKFISEGNKATGYKSGLSIWLPSNKEAFDEWHKLLQTNPNNNHE